MVEAVRMVADWLSGATKDVSSASQAVSVQLAAMTYDGTDTAPTAPTVVDETRDGSAARRDNPTTLPALAVELVRFTMEAGMFQQIQQEGTCQVAIRYIASNTTSENAVRDGYYVMRAVRRSLWRLHMAQEANNGRLRNSIALLPSATQPLEIVQIAAQKEDGGLYTAMLATYDVREQAP